MTLALIIACFVAVAALLRVLAGLVQELLNPLPAVVAAYMAKFHPVPRRGDLIVLPLSTVERILSRKTRERVALLVLFGAGLALPSHGQQPSSAQASSPDDRELRTANPPASQDVIQELDAMKRRIEQLETQLRQRPR